MGFQRAYMAAGDPGLFGKFFKRALRIPKGIRKLKFGRLALAAAPFIPGIGPFARIAGVASRFLPGKARPQEEESAGGFAEQHVSELVHLAGRLGIHPETLSRVLEEGDPGLLANLRAIAAGGGTLADVPHARPLDPRSVVPRDRGSVGQTVLENLKRAAASTAQFGGALLRRDPGAVLGLIARGGRPAVGAPGAPRGAGRRTMNATNVKALRRSLRRVEGFKNLVKRVEKQFPSMKHRPHLSSMGQRLHRAGCACVICKRSR